MEEGAEDPESSRSSKLGRFRGMLESGASKFRRSLNENNGTISVLPPDDDDNNKIPAASAPLPEDPPAPAQVRPKLGGLLSRTENVKPSRGSGADATPASAPPAAPAVIPPPAVTPPPTPASAKVAAPPSPPPPVRKKPTGKNIATFFDLLNRKNYHA
ncbi:vegetative cell wall protein gp1-like [Salvia splendens]|uniref:vegetative cell wall protein gp1-like n=1 Tax=Salvia splendens TaxID=180675 RepID=UPI001C2662F4|nr:vegetative cell wall protein gp1-like [Salvia splendens]